MTASEDSKTEPSTSVLTQNALSEEGLSLLVPAQHEETVSKSDGNLALLNEMKSAGGRLLFVFINSLTGILTARSLHPVGRGELAAMGVWPNIIPNLLTLGLPSALIFEYGRRGSNRVTILRCALALAICFGLISTVIGIVAMP